MRFGFKTLAATMALAIAATAFVATDANADAKYKVAYIARSQRDSFAAWLANSIITEAKKYPDVTLTVFDGQSKNEVMQSLIENAVQNKFDLTIVQSNDPAVQLEPTKAAIAQGMKIVATNPKFDDESIPYVDANPYQQGGENAKLGLKQIPQNAQVVVLMGPPGNPHSEGRRTAWQKEFFDKRPDVKLIDQQYANWNKDEGMRHTEDWITAHPQIDAVISMNDNMAAGAIEAIKAAGGKIHPLVYGVDGTAEACLLIKEGAMTSTTLQNANELAVRVVKMAHDILTKANPDIHQMIQAKLYTKDNVDECIDLHKSIGDIK
jgi:inositol transport system substrate-binding protein